MSSAKSAPYNDIIIGGGILGLWCAEFALRAGRRVLVLEAQTIGAGASGGLLGALMPHQPVGWSDKKALQYEGLMRLPAEIARLEQESGISCDYRRPGRIMPVRKQGQLSQSAQWVEGAKANWPARHGFEPAWHLLEQTHTPERWFSHDETALGANFDTLSACIDPRKLLAALAKSIRQKGGEIIEHCAVEAIGSGGIMQCSNGRQFQGDSIIIAAGYQSFPMVQAHFAQDLGIGVKGQAALLAPQEPVDASWPIIYDNGLYLIARPDGLVALGSTSENNWQDATSTDAQLDLLIERAKQVSPCLANARIIERWAAIRSKTHSRVPYAGPIEGQRGVYLLTGGFKITLGIAHIMAESLMRECGQAT